MARIMAAVIIAGIVTVLIMYFTEKHKPSLFASILQLLVLGLWLVASVLLFFYITTTFALPLLSGKGIESAENSALLPDAVSHLAIVSLITILLIMMIHAIDRHSPRAAQSFSYIALGILCFLSVLVRMSL